MRKQGVREGGAPSRHRTTEASTVLGTMASFNASSEGRSSWGLQTKARASIPEQTPAAQSAAMFGTHVWKFWTDVPSQPKHDPFIADQMRPLRHHCPGPSSSPAPEPFGGGKRQISAASSEPHPAGKRAFPEIVGRMSTEEAKPKGLRYVQSRARHTHAVLADPNTAVQDAVFKPESVKMFKGFNEVNYHCWLPHELAKAEKGDWNWNNSLGFRKVNLTTDGEPRRGLENPVAWPTYKGYPPSRDTSGQAIDYALKVHGRQGGFTLKTQNADVLESRRNRAAASNTRITPGGASAMSQTAPQLYKRGAY